MAAAVMRRAAAWIVVLLSLAAGGSARAEFLDWSDVTWPAGTLGPRVYTGGDLASSTVTTTVLDASGVRPSGFPVISTGFNGFDHAFRLRADFANTSQVISLRYVLTAPVSNARFDIGDIDTGDATSPFTGWQDIVTITAFRGATEVPVTIVSRGSAVGFDASNDFSTGLNATIYGQNGDIEASSTAGNARISIAGPVDQIRIDYRSGNAPDDIPGEGPTNPSEQGINFHDLIFDARADLSLTKVASTSTPSIGQTVNYTLTLTNGGPAAATNVTVADVLPGGLTYVAGSIAGGSSRSASPPNLSWTVTTLASGASTNLTFSATIDAPTGAAGEYDNRAQVTASQQPDPDSTPNNGTGNAEDDRASAIVTPVSTCAVTLVPARSATIGAAQTVYLAHVLTNTGNGSDVFDFTVATGGAFTPSPIAWYRDLGTVGVYNPGVDVLLTDTDGDTRPDTGTLAPAATLALLVAATGPNASFSGAATVATTATTSLPPSCGGGTAASATVTDTLTAAARVSGHVYADANHDATRNAGEAGAGLTLHAKLVPAATPTGPASLVVPVDPATGAFVFPAVPAGSWILLYDTSNTVGDVTPTRPAGWLRTEEPDAIRTFVVSSSDVTAQNFGLYRGSRVEGLVFDDDGRGGGVAGNGLLDGTEAGIGGVAVRATATGCGGSCDADTTDASGAFALWIPFAANGQTVQVIETDPAGYVSTGGSPGTTGGSYALATDRVTFTNATGNVYTALRFADLSGSGFAPDHQRAAMPGTAVFYPHVFSAGPSGSVRFSATHVASPAISGWAQSVFHDADCSATLDAAEPALQPGDAVPVAAGGRVCVVLRESVPPGAPSGAQDLVTVTAEFSAAGGASASSSVTDLTTVGLPSGLVLEKSVDKTSAEPGEVLVYTITYRNDGAAPITQLVIADATPGWTTYVPASAGCGALPPLVSACTPTPPSGATGPVTWTFTGALAPGASGTVTYSVTIDPP